LTHGYIAGGFGTSSLSSSQKCSFASNTFSSSASSDLANARYYLGGAGVDAGRSIGGGSLSGGGSIYVQMASVPCGGICSGAAGIRILRSEISIGGVLTGGYGQENFINGASGGATVGGDGQSVMTMNSQGSGGTIVGGQVEDVVGSGGVAIGGSFYVFNFVASGGVRCGGSFKDTIKKFFVSDGGEILTGGESSYKIKYFFNQDIQWNTKKAIIISKDFEWNTGEQLLRWYRVQGSCQYINASGDGDRYPGGCDVIGLQTDDDSCSDSPSRQQFVQNFVARSLRDLCKQIKDSRLNWSIRSIKRYSRPADPALTSSDDQCNQLVEVPYCDIPECLPYCVQDYSLIKSKAKLYLVDTILNHEGNGVIYTGGSATCLLNGGTPTTGSFNYFSQGGEILVEGSAETSSYWENDVVVNASANFEILTFEPVFGEQPTEQFSSSIQFVDSCSTCDNMPTIIYMHHNIGNSSIFDNFLSRNGLKFPNPMPLHYSSRLGGWLGNYHLSGVGDDNLNNQESWRFVFEWACLDEIAGETLSDSYKLSLLVVRKNLATNVDLETRIVLVFSPEPICKGIRNLNSDFSLSFNVKTNYVSNNFDILPNSVLFLDKINLFKSSYWSNYPNFKVRLSNNELKSDLSRKNIISLVPEDTPLRVNNTSDIITV
jgi:hypothetical protein